MITPQRSELLQIIHEISELYPEMRLGQLITNLASMAIGPTPEGIWDAEDDELLNAARELAANLRTRAANVV